MRGDVRMYMYVQVSYIANSFFGNDNFQKSSLQKWLLNYRDYAKHTRSYIRIYNYVYLQCPV